MRRWFAIAKTTALEILSEPLTLLTTLSALAMTVLSPAFHYHAFGEASRTARDAGFSALLVCGAVVAIFGTIRTFRRELETGTAQAALALAVSRRGFFLAKTLGAMFAYALFCVTISWVMLTTVRGAELGAIVADETGDVRRIWGPSFAWGVAALVFPLLVAALLNRFGRFRFVLTAFVTALITAVIGGWYRFDGALALRLWPVAILSALPASVLLVASAAVAVRFRTPVAASISVALALVLLPVIGNYCVSDALEGGGALAWSYFGAAGVAALPAWACFLILGVALFDARDV